MRRPFSAATVEFLAHTLCGFTSHSYVASTKVLAESKAPRRNPDFYPFGACLMLACLVAKLITLTLNTKEGYKTKTGSPSSVTPTLTKIESWDRASGGRNIF